MRHRLPLALVFIAFAIASALAQVPPPPMLPLPFPDFQGTADEQKACQPAVFKFCQAAVPDTMRILQCLQTNRARIGKPCQDVLAAHGQ